MTLHDLDLQRALAAAKGFVHTRGGWVNTRDSDRWTDDLPNWHTDPALALELAVELPEGWHIHTDAECIVTLVGYPPNDEAIVCIEHDNTVAGLRVALCEAIGNAWLEGKK